MRALSRDLHRPTVAENGYGFFAVNVPEHHCLHMLDAIDALAAHRDLQPPGFTNEMRCHDGAIRIVPQGSQTMCVRSSPTAVLLSAAAGYLNKQSRGPVVCYPFVYWKEQTSALPHMPRLITIIDDRHLGR